MSRRVVACLVIALVMAVVAGTAQAATPSAFAVRNVRAFAGGDSIAVLWNPPPINVDRYLVYRNSKLLATVRREGTSSYLYDDGTRYYDTAVQPGTTYSYQVVAVNDSLRSPRSKPVKVRQPQVAVPQVTVDASGAPDLAPSLEAGKKAIETWYPKIEARLALPDYQPPQAMTLKLTNDAQTVAYTDWQAAEITVGIDYLRQHPDDMGMFVHEATHVMQAYGGNVPGLITEGLADWTREQTFADRKPQFPPGSDYAAGYGESAFFLQWVANVYQRPDLVHLLNVTAHNGGDIEAVFRSVSGQSSAQLGARLQAVARA